MTPKQKRIFDYIVAYIADNGYAPTYRDIMKKFHLRSTSSIARYMTQFEQQELIYKRHGRNREFVIRGAR